jgi:demethylmenaquinone methyltransferase/2-methoxy-6-polyprenyl-1,4-benzoquinol methylase
MADFFCGGKVNMFSQGTSGSIGLQIIWKAIWHMTRWGCLAGMGLGGMYGTMIYPGVGTLFGMAIGGMVGIPLGIVTGINAGVLTYGFFYPLGRVCLYRGALAIITGLVTLMGAFLGFSTLFYGPGSAYYTLTPTLIATGCAIYASSRFADHYLHIRRPGVKSKKRKTSMYDEAFLKRLFDDMQSSYDRVSDLTSLGFNRRWRQQLIEQMALQPGSHVTDWMAGGGETWRYLLPRIGAEGHITAVDFSSAMLQQARKRQQQLGAENITIHHENALSSSIPDASLDAVICVYGVKTLSPDQQRQFVQEVRRVLKDGGQVGVVEVSIPVFLPLREAYMVYLSHVVPLVGRLLLGNPASYRMLGRYLRTFGDCDSLVSDFRANDFAVHDYSFFHGCATALVGTKQGD